jgi:hypothetical protein
MRPLASLGLADIDNVRRAIGERQEERASRSEYLPIFSRIGPQIHPVLDRPQATSEPRGKDETSLGRHRSTR